MRFIIFSLTSFFFFFLPQELSNNTMVRITIPEIATSELGMIQNPSCEICSIIFEGSFSLDSSDSVPHIPSSTNLPSRGATVYLGVLCSF